MSYEFRTDAQSKEFFDQIAGRMVALFGIEPAEAMGRMNRLWKGQSFVGNDTLIYQEDEDFWANNVYYGGDAKWRRNPADLKPLPYP